MNSCCLQVCAQLDLHYNFSHLEIIAAQSSWSQLFGGLQRCLCLTQCLIINNALKERLLVVSRDSRQHRPSDTDFMCLVG